MQDIDSICPYREEGWGELYKISFDFVYFIIFLLAIISVIFLKD